MQVGIPSARNLWVNLGYFWAGMQLLIVWVAIDNILLLRGWACGIRAYSEMGYHLFQSSLVGFATLYRLFRSNYVAYSKVSGPTNLPVPAAVSV